MEAIQDNYPFFEANQVLANTHLNQAIDYLDEQERLTRANLIGIGIVCGLDIRLETAQEGPTIHLSKGCGVTSQGYLILEPDDVALVSYRDYKLPEELDYSPFKDRTPDHKPYSMWELFPAGEPDVTPLGTPANFIDDKAVLLFLELKKEPLRNCSPNNCDDKGAEVTATTRRLLVKTEDLDKIVAEANKLESSLTSSDLETVLLARLKLRDLRLPRYDAPNTTPVTSNDVLAAFHSVFRNSKLGQETGGALSSAYDAFKPLVQTIYPNNPFTGFSSKFGFLDSVPKTMTQVRFLQYYYDFFDDLLKAYDEFRWKGAELMCACCPPEGLFPRHLMLGALVSGSGPSVYRHHFLASPAIGACAERTSEVKQLFQRIVAMIEHFTNTPPLPQSPADPNTDRQIRITPSLLGSAPLSDKAVPYYYQENGTPPLFRLWNFEKTRRNRANQNLSYRSDEYTPTAPPFVTDALRYDLEPYNFLRIEGHLGKNYQTVLETLLSLKNRYRLAIEIIALRTGPYDEKMALDLDKEDCQFQDLETLYDSLREELLSTLTEGVMYLYNVAVERGTLPGGTPELPLLKKYAPTFRHAQGSVGAWYEKYLTLFQSRPYIEVDQSKIDNNAILMVYCFLFAGTSDLPEKYWAHAVSIYYLTKLAEVLPASLDALGFSDFENKYQDLMGLVRYFRSDAVTQISDDLKQFIPQEELIDHFDHVLFSCKLEPIRAVHEEYVRRIRDVKQKKFLSFFLEKNPAIQHKAGVPIGGTFIIVYHGEPSRLRPDLDFNKVRAGLRPVQPVIGKGEIDERALSDAFRRIGEKLEFVQDRDIRLVMGVLTGQVPDPSKIRPPGTDLEKIIEAAVNEIANETVIADFYLPYICCSECPPVQFTLPKTPPTFGVQIGCTNPDQQAEVTVTPKGGVAPYTYKLDQAAFLPLTGKVLIPSGSHTLVIQDSEGTQSDPLTVAIPEALTIGKESYSDDTAARTYRVTFSIAGGKAPYTANTGAITGNTYMSPPVRSEEPITIEISDSVGCKTSKEFKHTVAPPCDLPCDGIAMRCGYRLWLPEPEPNRPYKSFGAEVPAFMFEFPQGESVDLAREVNTILNRDNADALNSNFNNVVQSWLKRINALIASKTGSEDWLRLGYSKSPKDPFETLWIEHFECLKFEIRIHSFFQRPEASERLDMVYTPKGTLVRNFEIELPPFNCIRTDKCDPERPQVARCAEVDMALKISKSVEGASVTLDVTPSGRDRPAAFLWEVQDGSPAVSDEKKSRFTFPNADGIKTIRLTGFTEQGCAVTVIDAVNLRPTPRRRGPR